MEADTDECGLSSGEPVEQREDPLGSVNGKPETDDKENNNGMSTDEIQAVRYDFRKDNETHTELHEVVLKLECCIKQMWNIVLIRRLTGNR